MPSIMPSAIRIAARTGDSLHFRDDYPEGILGVIVTLPEADARLWGRAMEELRFLFYDGNYITFRAVFHTELKDPRGPQAAGPLAAEYYRDVRHLTITFPAPVIPKWQNEEITAHLFGPLKGEDDE